jgi:REP element-mobilizing transposase RayT
MPRALRILQHEYPYHITTRTNGRIFAFKRWTYKIIISVLVDTTKRYDVKIEHFKMMDNHYHLKLTTPSSDIDRIMWFINNQIAKRLNKRNGVTGHLWGARYHATIVQTDEHANRCVRYLYNNGVRAGLCKRASEDERFSTFDFYAKGKKLEFSVTEDSVYLMLGGKRAERQQQFCLMVDGNLDEAEIQAIQAGLRKLFYGSADFIERMKKKYLSH